MNHVMELFEAVRSGRIQKNLAGKDYVRFMGFGLHTSGT